jgi:hypothetical protein
VDEQPVRGEEPFIGHPREVGEAVAAVFGPPAPTNERWTFAAWSWLVADLPTRQWLADRYPEWLTREREPQTSLAQFSVLVNIAAGLGGDSGLIAFWSLDSAAAQNYARRS